MRVLLVTHISFDDLTYAGGNWIRALLSAMKESQKYEVGVAYISSTLSEPWHENGVDFFPILHRRTFLDKVVDKFVIRAGMIQEMSAVRRIVDTFSPDIIQLFGLETEIGGIVDFIEDVPVVVHIQGIISECVRSWFPHDFNGHEVRNAYPLISRIRHVTPSDMYRKSVLRSRFELQNMQHYRYYLGRTDWDKWFVERYSCGGRYFHCDELLRTEFQNAVWRFKKGRCVISTVSNGEIYKGYDNVFKTAEVLCARGFDFVWNVYGVDQTNDLVGLFEKKYGGYFSDLNVFFCGKKSAEMLANALSESSLYVHPSHIDNSPNSVCEAMMAGVPVIAVNVGGVGSLIDDGVDGFLVDDYSYERMADLICEIHGNDELLSAVSMNARRMAMARNSPESVLADLGNAYDFILNDFKEKSV